MNNKKLNNVIRVEGARQNNLKNLAFELPLRRLIVLTGLSGSGKTSLAFDTLYAEGQRRYVETFSPYARQFLEKMDKPMADSITGIPPAIAIGQVNSVRTSRSTVGTITEISDYLKLLFPFMAQLKCPSCGRWIRPRTAEDIVSELLREEENDALIFFPSHFPKNASWSEAANFLKAQGFLRIWSEGKVFRLDEDAAPFQQWSASKGDHILHVVQDRVRLSASNRLRLIESIAAALRLGKGVVWVQLDSKEQPLRFSSRWFCPYENTEFEPPTPALFSFNNPVGACPACRGFGRSVEIDYDLALPNKTLSVAQGVVKPWQTGSFDECQKDLLRACRRKSIPVNIPFLELPREQQKFILNGEAARGRTFDEIWEAGDWYGVKGFFDWLETKTYKMHIRVLLSKYRAYRSCRSCGGSRFQEKTSQWFLQDKNLPEINRTPLRDLEPFFQQIQPPNESAKIVLEQIRSRLSFLLQTGLGYLTLDRMTRTLSGGEFQRVNLTACLGASLVNTLFVLDEPSIGLHPRDTHMLLRILRSLRDRGNTVLIVEHDESVIRAADHVLELGPLQGEKGGQLVFQGSARQLEQGRTLTGRHLSGQRNIPLPASRRACVEADWLKFQGASKHNICDLDFKIPLRRFVVVTGVSGSGKSTLVHEIVHKTLLKQANFPVDDPPEVKKIAGDELMEEVIWMNQEALTKTSRSAPILYLGAYDRIRALFALTDEAQRVGLDAGDFSFNGGAGRCERCGGAGFEKISMQFLSDVHVQCPVCEGRRFQKHVLQIRYRGKSIDEILRLTANEAIVFFSRKEPDAQKRETALRFQIAETLFLLVEVGLGYLQLGQPLNQLSGGESQRLKLASHLALKQKPSPNAKKTKLFIFDEPTTGLHLEDIRGLMIALQRLVDQGHSLLVIEHHLDVIKCADWILDLGPEGGDQGGKLVVAGTPETVAARAGSATGRFLRAKLGQGSRIALEEKIACAPQEISPLAIQVRGARHHNLQNISVDIPHDQLVVLTGLSGSGKSTLAFDLIFAEGQRRYLDCLNSYARQFIHQLERPDVDSIAGIPPAVAIEQRAARGGGKSTVATVTELYQFMRLLYAKLGAQHDPDTGEPAERQTTEQIVRAVRRDLKRQGKMTLLAPLVRNRKGFHTEIAQWAVRKGFQWLRADGAWVRADQFKKLARHREHNVDVVLGDVTPSQGQLDSFISQALRYGRGVLYALDRQKKQTIYSAHYFCPSSGRFFEPLDPRFFSFNSPHGWCSECQGFGFIFSVETDAQTEAEREQQTEWAAEIEREGQNEEQLPCPSCKGARLNPIARAVRFEGKPVTEINRMTVREFEKFYSKLKWSVWAKTIARDIRPEIEQRIRFLKRVGLDYLNLDRAAPTLSGGESQRISLAAQLGSNLQGALYVLDEPTIGLHPRDNEELLRALRELQRRGNSLLVVEHDETTLREADHIIDLGPGAGKDGGQIVAQGSWRDIAAQTKSVTGALLGQPLRHPSRGARRPVSKQTPCLRIEDARANNLKNISVDIPLGRLTVISGVSGAGKSSLMRRVLMPAVESKLRRKRQTPSAWTRVSGAEQIGRVVEVDQSPIGKTSRSTVCTYIGLMDSLRNLFAQTPEARARGFGPTYFSHNTSLGCCPACKGQGMVKVEMNFLPATYVVCETCDGKRWTEPVLEVKYRGKNIFEVLRLSVDEAAKFFAALPQLAVPLQLLKETGLGYLALGQTSPTLSGGEAQRVKLVAELAAAQLTAQRAFLRARDDKPHLYLLEEPTVGLHLADVQRLIETLHRLVDNGHTVVVIEHHLDVIAEADYVIDLGPEGGAAGGRVVFAGTPEGLVKSKKSHTARFLKRTIFTKQNSSTKTRVA
ncbi:MAG: excinuclease ABC subunit UvrA [bacterium]